MQPAQDKSSSASVPSRLSLKLQIGLGWLITSSGAVIALWGIHQLMRADNYATNADGSIATAPSRYLWIGAAVLFIAGCVLALNRSTAFEYYYRYVHSGTISQLDVVGGGDYRIRHQVWLYGLTRAGEQRHDTFSVTEGEYRALKLQQPYTRREPS